MDLLSAKPEDGSSLLAQALTKSGWRNAKTSFCIVAAPSVKNTDCAGAKGYDAGQKASAIKRHIVVASPGLPHAIAVTKVNVADRQGALEALEQNKKTLI